MEISNCRFCNLNAEKTRIIEDNKHTTIVLSNPRLMPAHILVLPKRHVVKLSELNEEEINELISKVIEYQDKIILKIAKGCDIRQNCRPFQKEDELKVDHLHIHLQPRELFDELYEKCQIYEKQIFKELTEEEKDKFCKLLNN